ncbi:hypothetical protein OYT88_15560 [Sporolactobacillus sp. CQH2019]|uniref:hypothetical protein n=1 Tax=Sporolactobacillus sp. CQH2019 TaxID=3023512 RepID=UPI002367810A|nr:hypothetical protein [Sporolactobacillus sp. CQH2019]MDD9149968.1 hypothetical protein [Sporolactobacillus sp. CQH2019]
MPYIEDAAKYHQYEVTGNFSDIEKIISNCKDQELKDSIDTMVFRYYNGDYSKLIPQSGQVASGFAAKGGAVQYELPLTVDYLEKLGLLREIN